VAPGYGVLAHLHRSFVLDVYDVWSEERACRCVAKLLRPDRVGDREERGRLLQEGRLLVQLSHPHIVRAYELVERPQPILILETLTGATLARLIAERGRLPLADLALLGLHLGSAMHYLHRRGFLHLDLKPSNIICDGGLARVIDLSIARPPGAGRPELGTTKYMAPEQARGDVLGPATDAWGIGAVLFEAATGRPPFRAYRAKGRYAQLEGRAEQVRSHRRLPAALANAIDACLEPAPARRPTVDDLLRIMAGLV
jgi:serine/threonine protein kinase